MANQTLQPGWNSLYASATGGTLAKSGPGVLHTLVLNKPVATSVISFYDSSTTGTLTGTLGSVTVPSSPQPVTLRYDVSFVNGLVVNMATAVSDITVSFI